MNQDRSRTVKKQVTIILFFLLVLGGLFSYPKSVNAGELNFTVTPILPENQIDKTTGYFDLHMKPSQQQTLEVELSNLIDQELTVEMYATTAVTNLNGVIEYKDLDPRLDTSLKHPFQTIAQVPESIVLSGNETKRVAVEITMPEEEYTGMILGGLYFKEKHKEEPELSDQKGMGVRNVFSYILAVKLTENETELQPDLKLLEARAGQVNYHNAFEAQLQNPQSVEMNNLTVTAQVVKQGSSTVLYEETREGLRMAPNSNFYYPIPLNGGAFEPGKYEMIVKAHTPEQEWSLKTPFEITADEAKQINEESVEDLAYSPNYWLWIALGSGVIVIVVAGNIFWSRYKLKKMQEQMKQQLNIQQKAINRKKQAKRKPTTSSSAKQPIPKKKNK